MNSDRAEMSAVKLMPNEVDIAAISLQSIVTQHKMFLQQQQQE